MARTLSIPLLLLFLLGVGGASAFNITHLLEPAPEFSTFNMWFKKVGIASEVNHRQTITILALDNGAMGAVQGLDEDVVADVLRIHVILDYYDLDKLHETKKHTTILTTLFQATGRAANMGFLNATVFSGGEIRIGSSAPHEPLSARVVKKVLARPYNISVLQLDSAIVPQGLRGVSHPTPPPSPAPPKAPAPVKPPVAKPPATDGADAPTSASPSKDDAPAPVAAPPTDNVAPVADAPTTASPATADAPATDAPNADSPTATTGAPTSESPSPMGPTASYADAPTPADEEDESSAGWRSAVGGSMVGTAVMAMVVALLYAEMSV